MGKSHQQGAEAVQGGRLLGEFGAVPSKPNAPCHIGHRPRDSLLGTGIGGHSHYINKLKLFYIVDL